MGPGELQLRREREHAGRVDIAEEFQRDGKRCGRGCGDAGGDGPDRELGNDFGRVFGREHAGGAERGDDFDPHYGSHDDSHDHFHIDIHIDIHNDSDFHNSKLHDFDFHHAVDDACYAEFDERFVPGGWRFVGGGNDGHGQYDCDDGHNERRGNGYTGHVVDGRGVDQFIDDDNRFGYYCVWPGGIRWAGDDDAGGDSEGGDCTGDVDRRFYGSDVRPGGDRDRTGCADGCDGRAEEGRRGAGRGFERTRTPALGAYRRVGSREA